MAGKNTRGTRATTMTADREIVPTRHIGAPRDLLFDAISSAAAAALRRGAWKEGMRE
jgi:hypothetical protein